MFIQTLGARRRSVQVPSKCFKWHSQVRCLRLQVFQHPERARYGCSVSVTEAPELRSVPQFGAVIILPRTDILTVRLRFFFVRCWLLFYFSSLSAKLSGSGSYDQYDKQPTGKGEGAPHLSPSSPSSPTSLQARLLVLAPPSSLL